jgi:hypothetical protein
MDTGFGMRVRLIDELQDEAPVSLALRVGGVVPGRYEVGYPGAPGDGVAGVETSVLAGRTFARSAWGTYGELGFRLRGGKVPNDAFGSVGFFRNLGAWSLSSGVARTQGLSGIDIGDPGFTAARFPETREIFTALEVSGGWTYAGGRHVGVTWARVLAGRNTGRRSVLSVGYAIPVGRRPVS